MTFFHRDSWPPDDETDPIDRTLAWIFTLAILVAAVYGIVAVLSFARPERAIGQ